jgi:uncharacterized membrane protein YeaQ/YmgE (transglycosylase-associated protein family)
MWITSWVILGGLAGWIASMIAGKDAKMGLLANIAVGIVGAMLGGFILGLFGIDGVTGFNVWSLLVAVFGAVVALWLLSLISGKDK